MRALMISVGTLIFAAGFVAGDRLEPRVGAQEVAAVMDCGTTSVAQLRTTLYFGLARPKGSVSELEWQIFLRDEVTRRFPDGLTVWEAEGQWRTPAGTIDHEQSKVLLLVHSDTTAARIGSGRHRGVPQDIRAGIGSVGKRARVWRGLVEAADRGRATRAA